MSVSLLLEAALWLDADPVKGSAASGVSVTVVAAVSTNAFPASIRTTSATPIAQVSSVVSATTNQTTLGDSVSVSIVGVIPSGITNVDRKADAILASSVSALSSAAITRAVTPVAQLSSSVNAITNQVALSVSSLIIGVITNASSSPSLNTQVSSQLASAVSSPLLVSISAVSVGQLSSIINAITNQSATGTSVSVSVVGVIPTAIVNSSRSSVPLAVIGVKLPLTLTTSRPISPLITHAAHASVAGLSDRAAVISAPTAQVPSTSLSRTVNAEATIPVTATSFSSSLIRLSAAIAIPFGSATSLTASVNMAMRVFAPVGSTLSYIVVGNVLWWFNGTQWKKVNFKRYLDGNWTDVKNVKAYNPATSEWEFVQ